jgi:hypothetical protein
MPIINTIKWKYVKDMNSLKIGDIVRPTREWYKWAVRANIKHIASFVKPRKVYQINYFKNSYQIFLIGANYHWAIWNTGKNSGSFYILEKKIY